MSKTPPGAGWPGGVFGACCSARRFGQMDEWVDIVADFSARCFGPVGEWADIGAG